MSGFSSPPGSAGVTDHGALTGLTDDDHVAYFRIETARTGTAPASVGTTPGTAATAMLTATGAVGGATSIATTGTGGVGAGFSWVGGAGGLAASANTASTGGKGGGFVWTGGAGGAATATGTNVGGAGGDLEITGGVGGAASGGTGNTGGTGGHVCLVGGAAGSGGSPLAGNVYLGYTSGAASRGVVAIGPDGTTALPALTWAGDLDTGISHTANNMFLSTTGVARLSIDSNGDITTFRDVSVGRNIAISGIAALNPAAAAGGNRTLDISISAHTAVTAEKEAIVLRGSGFTITGGFALQRFVRIDAPAIDAATPLTIVDAATLWIGGAPSVGGAGPAAITNSYALWVDAGNSRFDGTILSNGGAQTICGATGNLASANGVAAFGPAAVASITIVNGIVTAIS